MKNSNLTETEQIITDKFGKEAVEFVSYEGLQYYIVIKKDIIKPVCLELRNNKTTYFDFLSCISGVDKREKEKRMEVVYHLCSIPFQRQLTLKVYINTEKEESISVPSISEVWRAGDWHEREIFDMFGVEFENHPDLRRILMPEDWEGNPLKKDYKQAEKYNNIKI